MGTPNNVNKCFRNSSKNKCTFHPTKSCIVCHTMNSHHLKTENWSSWTLGENPIKVKETSDHLGLVRGGSSEGQKNVDKESVWQDGHCTLL